LPICIIIATADCYNLQGGTGTALVLIRYSADRRGSSVFFCCHLGGKLEDIRHSRKMVEAIGIAKNYTE